MTVWFTADTHFGHERIIELCQRPFDTIEEMDTVLLSYWRRMEKGDLLYCLGDIAFKPAVLEQAIAALPGGVQMHILWGNHDIKKRKLVDDNPRVAWHGDRKGIKVQGQHIVVDHFPMRSWPRSTYGSWQLHGHCHGDMEPLSRQLDVGVDNAVRYLEEYRPFTFEEVYGVLADQPITDHHGREE